MYSIFKTERGVDSKNQVLLVNGGQKSMPVGNHLTVSDLDALFLSASLTPLFQIIS